MLIATLLFSASCVDEFWPELGVRYDKALVVDAMITDKPGPYTVKLSLSSTVEDPVIIPFSGCAVVIYDNTGNEELLSETELGVYQTSPGGIRGVVGKSYKISISTSEGKHYESDYQKLSVSTAIAKVHGNVEFRESAEGQEPIGGMQFYVDTYMAEQDTNYYLWRLEHTFKFNANHLIRYIYDGQFHRFEPIDSLFTCWRTSSVKQIYTYSTVNLQKPMITNLPLNFVNTYSKMLSIRYSLLVNQLSISQKAYNFWRRIEKLNEESGSLFSGQPYQVRGNVKNIMDKDEPVLGYFTVAGIAQKRIFVNRPAELNFYYRDECNLMTNDLRNLLWIIRNRWPVKLAGESTEFGLVPALVADEACIDCTKEYKGATILKPYFWED